MKDQPIPDTDHVARYCKASTVEDGEISAAAFMLREDERYLSVNWLEELKLPNRAAEITACKNSTRGNLVELELELELRFSTSEGSEPTFKLRVPIDECFPYCTNQ
jgi:hypothetical protein